MPGVAAFGTGCFVPSWLFRAIFLQGSLCGGRGRESSVSIRQNTGGPRGAAEIAEPIGRSSSGTGRPWLWRLREKIEP
jgi:hypothetical protein